MKLIVLAMCLLPQSCAMYHYQYETQHGICSLDIWSMREVKAADLEVDNRCNLSGGAKQLGMNEKALKLMSSIVRKIP